MPYVLSLRELLLRCKVLTMKNINDWKARLW